MVDREYAIHIFGWFGLCFWTAISMAPVRELHAAWNEPKRLYRVSFYFLIFAHVNSVVWLTYGISLSIVMFIIPATSEMIFSLGQIMAYCYILNLPWKSYALQILGFDIIVAVSLRPVPIQYIAIIGMIVQLCVYIFQIESLKPVFKEKDSKYIDMVLLSVCWANSFSWLMWALYSNY